MIRLLKYLLALCLCLGFSPLYSGDLSTELFDQGNQYYEKGQFDSAAASYEKILSLNRHDPKVYYNLGNANFRMQKLGLAVLNFEKARLLDPSDADIETNVLFAKAATADKIIPPEPSFFSMVLSGIHNLFSIRTEAVLFLVLLNLLALLLMAYFSVTDTWRDLVRTLGFILLPLFVLLSVSFGIKVWNDARTLEGVVLSHQVNAMNEPDGSQILFAVHEGTKFRLHRRVGNWYFGTLENGTAGWVPENELGLIKIE